MQNKLTNYLLIIIAILLACFLFLAIYTLFFKVEPCEAYHRFQNEISSDEYNSLSEEEKNKRFAKRMGLAAACDRSTK